MVGLTVPLTFSGCLGIGAGCNHHIRINFSRVSTDEIITEAAESDIEKYADSVAVVLTDAVAGDNPTIEYAATQIYASGADPDDVHSSWHLNEWLPSPTIESDDSFYRITNETITTATVTGPHYILSAGSSVTDESDNDQEMLDFESLPPHDRRRLLNPLRGIPDGGEDIEREFGVVGGYIDSTRQSNSVLAEGIGSAVLVYEDQRIRLDQVGQKTVDAKQIRYTADQLATSKQEFADYVLSERGAKFSPDNSSVERLLTETRASETQETRVCLNGGGGAEAASERKRTARKLDQSIRSRQKKIPGDHLQYINYNDEWHRIDVVETSAP